MSAGSVNAGGGMQYGAGTLNSYAQGGTQSAATSGGKCSCFGGCFKKLSDRGAGMSAGSANAGGGMAGMSAGSVNAGGGMQYGAATQNSYAQGGMQSAANSGGKCFCFGGCSKKL